MEGDLGQEPGVLSRGGTFGGMCHDNGYRQEPPASMLYLAQGQNGGLSPTIGCSTRHWFDPFARAKSILLLMINGPSERELADKTAN